MLDSTQNALDDLEARLDARFDELHQQLAGLESQLKRVERTLGSLKGWGLAGLVFVIAIAARVKACG